MAQLNRLMSEPDSFHHFIDQPASWQITTKAIDIRGWVYAKNGEELTDVRARLDGVITYGIMGLDRPDLEEYFKGGLVARRSGFRVTVQPWLGARLLVLEALRPGNVWTEFMRTNLETSGPEMPARPQYWAASSSLPSATAANARSFQSSKVYWDSGLSRSSAAFATSASRCCGVVPSLRLATALEMLF